MTGLMHSRLGAAALGAALVLGMGSTGAFAGDGFSGDLSVSYNSHFISYGSDVWKGGHKIFSNNSPTFVNGDLYWTKGNLTLTGNVWFDLIGGNGDGVANANPLGGSIQEVDLNIGAAYTLGLVTLSATYGRWNYGSDSEGIVDLAASFNDADMLIKGFAINPKVLFHIRTDRGAGQLGDGTAIVLSVAPSLSVLGPVSLSFPAGVVFFTDDQFQNGLPGSSGYGYSYVGASLAYTLDFIPKGYGTWSVFTDWIGYFTEKDAIPGNREQDFLTADVGIKLAF
jgi:hypothetical protein